MLKRFIPIFCILTLTLLSCLSNKNWDNWVQVKTISKFKNQSKHKEINLAFLPNNRYQLTVFDNTPNSYSYLGQNTLIRLGDLKHTTKGFNLESDFEEFNKPLELVKGNQIPDTAKFITIYFAGFSQAVLYKKENLIPFRISSNKLIATRLDPNKSQSIHKTHSQYWESNKVNFTTPEYFIKKSDLPVELHVISNYNNQVLDTLEITQANSNYFLKIKELPPLMFNKEYYQTYPQNLPLIKLNSNSYKIDSIWDFVNHKFYSDTLQLNNQDSMVYVQKGYLKHIKSWKKNAR